MLLALDFWYKGKHLEKGGCKAAFLAVSPNQIFADGGAPGLQVRSFRHPKADAPATAFAGPTEAPLLPGITALFSHERIVSVDLASKS
jgi:hypothetical protein